MLATVIAHLQVQTVIRNRITIQINSTTHLMLKCRIDSELRLLDNTNIHTSGDNQIPVYASKYQTVAVDNMSYKVSSALLCPGVSEN